METKQQILLLAIGTAIAGILLRTIDNTEDLVKKKALEISYDQIMTALEVFSDAIG